MLEDIQGRCTTARSSQDCYRRFHGMGFQYGPSFQAIEQLWVGTGEVLGRIRIAGALEEQIAEYFLHPVILDACFQLLLAVEPPEGAGNHRESNQYMPVGVGRIRVNGHPEAAMWAHARLVEYGPQALVGDVSLFDDAGHVIAEITGFRAQSLEQSRNVSTRHLDQWLYHLSWEPVERQEEISGDTAGGWIVFADTAGLGEQVAARLSALENTCVLVAPGDAYRSEGLRFTIDPTNPDHYERLLSDVVPVLPPLRGIVHLWSLDAVRMSAISSESLQRDQDAGCYSVMYLVQALATMGQSCRLWLMTRGAQPVDPETPDLSLAQAPLWGMGRVIGHQEHLALRGALVDLDPATPGDEADWVAREVLFPDGEDQIAFRHGERYVARLNRSTLSNTVLPPRLRADGSYLITGGLGALGLLVARWMVERGARRLILMGRTPLPPRSSWRTLDPDNPRAAVITAIRELEARGATVHIAAVDVAEEAQLATYLEEYQGEGWPPIRGVVHAAGVVRDQILMRMDRERFESVLRPKILGAWALHRVLADESLDFFVLFSSIASLVTSTGQANYAAGNAFLDALAFYRRAQGLSASAINWGPWAVGMIDELNLAEHYSQRGMTVIEPEQGLHLMDLLMGHNPIQSAVLAADWPRVFESYPYIPPMIHHLGRDETLEDASQEAEASVAERLLGTAIEERQPLVETYLQEVIGRVLRLDPGQLSVEEPLNTLGMDSMMAIELKNRVEQTLSASLSVVQLLQGATIADLATDLVAQVTDQGSSPAADVPVEAVETLSENRAVVELLADIERLSHEEIAALLADDLLPQEVA